MRAEGARVTGRRGTAVVASARNRVARWERRCDGWVDAAAHRAATTLPAAAQRWVERSSASTLTPEEQLAELQWFIEGRRAVPGNGDQRRLGDDHDARVRVAGATQAFEEITGISVTHDLIAEGDVIEKLQTQVQSGENIYDAYVNDSDLIGTHWRNGDVLPLSDYIAGDGAAITSPTLDLDDFIGISFTTAPDGKVYQLPDQQFANLYWFRYDWFTDPDIMAQFEEIYGYDLGVPVNWSAYEDIAKFFTNEVNGDGTIDGVESLWAHGLRQARPVTRLAVHRCVAVDGWQRRPRYPQRLARGRVGDPRRGLPAGRLVGDPRWRHQWSGVRLRPAEVHRLAQGLRAAGSGGDDVQRGRSRPGAGGDRPADLLVHGVHGRHDQPKACRCSTRTAARSGGWLRARTVRTGRTATSSAIRTPDRGRSSRRRLPNGAMQHGCTPSSSRRSRCR